jgi:carboxypeptidase Taq
VEPHPIRVESDETTYNLHIMLRFDIERALLRGDMTVADVPEVWNERMKTDLGLTVVDDATGCLQDIHWALGAIGYFPTYTLGNLYAAQFWTAAGRDLPSLELHIARGEFEPLLGWLRVNIHRHGHRFSAEELCQQITGSPMSTEPLIEYLRKKAANIRT